MIKSVNTYNKKYNNSDFLKVIIETDEEEMYLDFPATKTYEFSIEKLEDFINFLKRIISINTNENLFFNMNYIDIYDKKACKKYHLNEMDKYFYYVEYHIEHRKKLKEKSNEKIKTNNI